MNRTGPIIIIEDDDDDRQLFSDAYNTLTYTNELVFFSNGPQAIEHLRRKDVNPFLIISDINMPMMDGFEVRRLIAAEPLLAYKCMPYIFLTTASNKQTITEAYCMSIQGYFIKPASLTELINTIDSFMDYWYRGAAPGLFY